MKKIILFSFAIFLIPSFYIFAQVDNNLSQKMKGRILLQIEENGEAWYVHPSSMKRMFLGRPKDAFDVMRGQGVGITNKDLYKIPVGINNSGSDSDGDGLSDELEKTLGLDLTKSDTDGDGYNDKNELINGYNPWGSGKQSLDNNFSENQKGKILLQVEKNGEAWYVNPEDGKRYFLGRPVDAFNVMRGFGLGIKNDDIEQIERARNQIVTETENFTHIEIPENNSEALIFKGFDVEDFIGELEAVASTFNLEFSSSDCGNKIPDGYTHWNNTILDAKWENDALIIDTYDSFNCCPEKIIGRHTIAGNIITLNAEQKLGAISCMCTCPYKNRYEIANIDKKNYTIKFANDSLVLSVENKIIDDCNDKKNYTCYSDLLSSKPSIDNESFRGEPQISFFNPEDELVANKYLEFIEYYSKYSSYPYTQIPYECIELQFMDEGSYLGARKSNSCEFNRENRINPFGGGGWGDGGDSMEEIVVNYIQKIENAHSENSLYSKIKDRTGLNVLEITPNKYKILIEYNGEYYNYSKAGVDFSSYDKDYKYYKDGKNYGEYPVLEDVDRDTIVGLIEQINSIDKKIKEDENILEKSFDDLTVTIVLDKNVAIFQAILLFNEEYDDMRYALIHGLEILVTQPVMHYFSLDLDSWEIKMIKAEEYGDYLRG